MADPPSTHPFIVVRDGDRELGRLVRPVVAIGNFDGVHRGHRQVIATAMERARAAHRPAAVLTFEPHPRSFFHPEEPSFQLTSEAAKLRLLAATGLDGAVVLTFNAVLAGLSAEDFVERILVERLRVTGAVIGFNFHFGKHRRGSPDFLEAQGAQHGFSIDVVPPFQHHGRRVSSGAVRDALAAGHVAGANELLGFPWFVTAQVVHVADPELFEALVGIDLAEICITSATTLATDEGPAQAFRLPEVPGVAVVVNLAEGRKCARSWKISHAVGSDPQFPDVTPRDAQALREWEAMRKAAE